MRIQRDSQKRLNHVVLIFPPVWVPMVPHLALPVLTAYLREKDIPVTPIDANLDFFLNYLLTRETLETFLPPARSILKGKRPHHLSSAWLSLLRNELSIWEESIVSVDQIMSILRDERGFYNPNGVLPALDRIHGLLLLASIARWPGRISFNHYQRGDIWTERDLIELCEDEKRNIFLPFWKDRVLKKIRQISPILVGISISSLHQFIAALTLARLLRRELPRIHVVIGGKHVLRIQDKLIQHRFYFEKFFHNVVLYEGERPLELLFNTLVEGRDVREVPNLIHLNEQHTVRTDWGDSPPLETLPYPDFGDVPWGQYLVPKRYLPVRMSEGCYWGKCTFCARYAERGAAFIPPSRVADELERLGDVYGVRDVSVNDDCMPPEYWDEICSLIVKRRLDLSMLIWAKPVAGFTRRRLHLMAKAGVRQIRWGVESAHPRILRLMRKGTTLSTTERVLKDAHEAGIWNHTCIILGFPTETREEAQTTLDFLRSHQDVIQSFILYAFVLYRHSYIFLHPEEFGIRDLQIKDTPFFDTMSYTTERGMSQREVHSLVKQAKATLLDQTYGWPFWYYLKLREYLQLYLDRYGLEKTLSMQFRRQNLRFTLAKIVLDEAADV